MRDTRWRRRRDEQRQRLVAIAGATLLVVGSALYVLAAVSVAAWVQ